MIVQYGRGDDPAPDCWGAVGAPDAVVGFLPIE